MMLRRSNLRQIIKVSQCSYGSANSSATKSDVKNNEEISTQGKKTDHSKLVAAAFASLKEISIKTKHQLPSAIDVRIADSSDVNSLLAISEESISRHHALRIVSKLADWASMGRIKLSEFESDIRFAKVCRLLGQPGTRTDLGDLSIVLGVTADDQAAKLISSISLPQMIKVLSSLSSRGRRSTPVLRSLAFNIGRSSEVLSIKEAADVFYACATLNFPDEVLLAKVTTDIISSLKDNSNPSVVGSISRSAGILKYRDTELFENLCNWMVANKSICRAKDFLSLLLALANINCIPEKFPSIFEFLKPHLKEKEMPSYHQWLDVVWSLIALQKYDKDLIQSVLQPNFISQMLLQDNAHAVIKMKLLNINGIAQQLGSNYDGALLPPDSDVFQVPLARMKEKQLFINCVKETFSSIVNISEHFKIDVNTGMGFLIDLECRINSNSKLVKLSEWPKNMEHKVAIMICTYHDVCRVSDRPTGITALNYRLLENANYKLLIIPFSEFNPRDKLISRVQYLENKLKNCLN